MCVGLYLQVPAPICITFKIKKKKKARDTEAATSHQKEKIPGYRHA